MSDDVSILVLLDECEDAIAHVTATWGMDMDEEASWHAAEAIAAECWATVHALCSADDTAWRMDDKPWYTAMHVGGRVIYVATSSKAIPVMEAILIATDDDSSETPMKKATLEDDLLDLEKELSLAMAHIQTVDMEAIQPSAPARRANATTTVADRQEEEEEATPPALPRDAAKYLAWVPKAHAAVPRRATSQGQSPARGEFVLRATAWWYTYAHHFGCRRLSWKSHPRCRHGSKPPARYLCRKTPPMY